MIPTLDLRATGVQVFATQLHHTATPRQARDLVDGVLAQGFALVGHRSVAKLTFLRR